MSDLISRKAVMDQLRAEQAAAIMTASILSSYISDVIDFIVQLPDAEGGGMDE